MNGIVPLWKEAGMTSHDCVFKLRKILGTKKVGHTGTLDPAVEGVLPICVGAATRIAEYITDAGKEYEAIVSIGYSTETEDAEGVVVQKDLTYKNWTREKIEGVLSQLTGTLVQTPPMYSAVKVNGKRLYEYARKGQEIERPTRNVQIDSIELLDTASQFEGEEVQFAIRVACGKGTYIRTLAVQIGEALGYPAHMHALIRTASGAYAAKDCYTLDEVQQAMEQQKISTILRPIEWALRAFPQVPVTEKELPLIQNGQVLPIHVLLAKHERVVFTYEDKALAVYIAHPTKEGLMKPQKMFPSLL